MSPQRASLVRRIGGIVLILTVVRGAAPVPAAPPGTNEDESKVPAYTLPDPLTASDGTRVADASAWRERRRPEVLGLFEKNVYGVMPGPPKRMTFRVDDVDRSALGGLATRKQVSVLFNGTPDGPRMDLLLYVPNDRKGSVPAFLGLNFTGNQSICDDPKIRLSTSWFRDDPKNGFVDHRATEATRGKAASRWQVETVLKRGYALATAYYGDIDPDFDDGFKNGVHPLMDQGERGPTSWGSIGGWAWGLSRALDYLQTDPDIDARKVAVHGHSRLGKTALWAGARDERFALVISNDSGEGGAALSRRRFGETTKRINTSFPHWFCTRYRDFNDREDDLPVDQHMLIALIAPRPVLICSAQDDLWADPKGEFLSGLGADPVYRLLGTEGLPVKEMPGVNRPALGTIGYHLRPGPHDVTAVDWAVFLDFADKHFKR